MPSVPPPSVPPPSNPQSSSPPPSSPPPGPELVLALDDSRAATRQRAGEGSRLRLTAAGLSIEHQRVMWGPLELPLRAVKVATVDRGPARAPGQFGRFAVLRRLGPTTVVPQNVGIEGWLWTSTAGSALTNLGEDDEAPNVALVFAKPLDEATLRDAFDSEFVTALAAHSPLGSPAVPGLLFRVGDSLAAEQGFRRWGFQSVLTDRDVPPTMRRHLPTDRSADPRLSAGSADDLRAATSVAPPGMS